MKNTFTTIVIMMLLFITSVNAQAPQKMSYQAVIRNASGTLVSLTPVGIKISILQGSVSGSAVYVETHSAMTSSNGLISIEIGGGNVQSGSFTSIEWANGPYFVKTETDPNGGSNYTISGTSELLSVPYALYAENTKPQGKSTIYLTGAITDSQAEAQLAKELGPNTESVFIRSTTQLTNVNLNGLSSLLQLQVVDNAVLTSLNVSSLNTMYGDLSIYANPVLSTINLSALSSTIGKLYVANNSSLSIFALPSLYKSTKEIWITGNGNLASIDFPALIDISPGFEGSFYFDSKILITSNNLLSTINLPLLAFVSELKIISNPSLANLNISSLQNFSLELKNSMLTTLNIPSVTQGNFVVMNNSALTSVNLPILTSGYINIDSNATLNTISIPLYSNKPLGGDCSFQNNNLPSAQVNYILNRMLNVTPVSGKNIKLKQLPPAPPTGQGIIDKATLISTGNTVETN